MAGPLHSVRNNDVASVKYMELQNSRDKKIYIVSVWTASKEPKQCNNNIFIAFYPTVCKIKLASNDTLIIEKKKTVLKPKHEDMAWTLQKKKINLQLIR